MSAKMNTDNQMNVQHIIPTIRRGKKQADLWAYNNQFFDGEKTFQEVLFAEKSKLHWSESSLEDELGKSIFVASEGDKSVLACVVNGDLLMLLLPSDKFGGHCYVCDGKREDWQYLGTCEDVHQAYLDKIYTESRYIIRTENRVLGEKNGAQYSGHQQQIAQSFIDAATGARAEWLSQLNRFVVACGEINVGLPLAGTKPTDLVPKSLQYK